LGRRFDGAGFSFVGMENFDAQAWLPFLMPLAAFLYAAVGHGGASTYLTLLVLAGFQLSEVRPSALVLNILVASVAWFSYQRVSQIPWKLFGVLVLFSVPAAYFGALLPADGQLARKVLGLLLLFPILRLAGVLPGSATGQPKPFSPLVAAVLGGSIGLVSGWIGIGGGILLSPALLLLGWTDLKTTAAISALFIVVNSISGLLAQSFSVQAWPGLIWLLLPLTVAGGLAGAWLGSQKLTPPALRWMLALVLSLAAFKFLVS
jgi:uncharacterized protein